MALIDCSECGKHVSDKAHACPGCGHPINPGSQYPPPISFSQEVTLWEGHPSWLNYLGAWIVGVLLIPVFGLGFLVLIFSFFSRSGRRYQITSKRVISTDGIFVKTTREVRICDIRVVNVLRGGIVGLFGVGSVQFGSAGTSGIEVEFGGIVDPDDIRDIVNSKR